MSEQKLVLLVLSCDGYSDLWDDFFNLRDKYWADCPYKWYVVTETKDYLREGVEVVKCGKDKNWAARLRYAVQTIDAQYYGIYLEDYFIIDKVNNETITGILNDMDKYCVTFLNTSDVFYNCINMENKEYLKDHLIVIPNNRPYAISTESAIWEKEYLLAKLGNGDYSAWQFEIDRVNESKLPGGYGGFNLCDDRMPFHVSTIPVVIQGRIYPKARKFFMKQGYVFSSKRDNMSCKQVLLYNFKVKMSRMKYGKRIMKWFAAKFLGIKFFT